MRKIIIAAAAAFILAGVGAFVGATAANKIITANEIQIVNAEGEAVVHLGVDENGNGRVMLMDKKSGKTPSGIVLGFSKGNALATFLRDGKSLAAIGVATLEDGSSSWGAVSYRDSAGKFHILRNASSVQKTAPQTPRTPSRPGAVELAPGTYVVGQDSDAPSPGRYRVTAKKGYGVLKVKGPDGAYKTGAFIAAPGEAEGAVDSYTLDLVDGDKIETGLSLYFTRRD